MFYNTNNLYQYLSVINNDFITFDNDQSEISITNRNINNLDVEVNINQNFLLKFNVDQNNTIRGMKLEKIMSRREEIPPTLNKVISYCAVGNILDSLSLINIIKNLYVRGLNKELKKENNVTSLMNNNALFKKAYDVYTGDQNPQLQDSYERLRFDFN